MNYRHRYHAGNAADVVKHTLLVGLLNALRQKDKPFCVVDSHAGAGLYDLNNQEARKTGEADDGFGRIQDYRGAPPWVADYLNHVLHCQAAHGRSHYPGSPWLIQRALRPDDRALFLDLQEAEHAHLRHHFGQDARIGIHRRDAYEGLPALLPPVIRRGLVFIDPPYEQERGHYPEIVALIQRVVKQWPTGIVAVWFPIKQRANIVRFYRQLTNLGLEKILTCELLTQPDDNELGLNGSGVILINPPFQYEVQARAALNWLLPVLSDHPQRAATVRWLAKLEPSL